MGEPRYSGLALVHVGLQKGIKRWQKPGQLLSWRCKQLPGAAPTWHGSLEPKDEKHLLFDSERKALRSGHMWR